MKKRVKAAAERFPKGSFLRAHDKYKSTQFCPLSKEDEKNSSIADDFFNIDLFNRFFRVSI